MKWIIIAVVLAVIGVALFIKASRTPIDDRGHRGPHRLDDSVSRRDVEDEPST